MDPLISRIRVGPAFWQKSKMEINWGIAAVSKNFRSETSFSIIFSMQYHKTNPIDTKIVRLATKLNLLNFEILEIKLKGSTNKKSRR